MMARTKAQAETSTADKLSPVDAQRITKACIAKHISASDRRDTFGRPLPGEDRGWGKPAKDAGWGSN